jgi:hypothetical protein
MSTLGIIPGLIVAAAFFGQLLGVPTAWLKLRRTDVWASRPKDVRRIDLLASFTNRPTALAAMFGGLVGLATWLGTVVS